MLSAGVVDRIVASQPGLALLVLLGSRATGSEHPGSDWDVGVLGPDRGGGELDVAGLTAQLSIELGSDDVDVVDLRRASAVLRRDAAVDGRLLFERRPGLFMDFQIEVMTYWCDVEPVLREAFADVLRAAEAAPGGTGRPVTSDRAAG